MIIKRASVWIAGAVAASAVTAIVGLWLQLGSARDALESCQQDKADSASSIAALELSIERQNRAISDTEARAERLHQARIEAQEKLAVESERYQAAIERIRSAPRSDGDCEAVRQRLIQEAAR